MQMPGKKKNRRNYTLKYTFNLNVNSSIEFICINKQSILWPNFYKESWNNVIHSLRGGGIKSKIRFLW